MFYETTYDAQTQNRQVYLIGSKRADYVHRIDYSDEDD